MDNDTLIYHNSNTKTKIDSILVISCICSCQTFFSLLQYYSFCGLLTHNMQCLTVTDGINLQPHPFSHPFLHTIPLK